MRAATAKNSLQTFCINPRDEDMKKLFTGMFVLPICLVLPARADIRQCYPMYGANLGSCHDSYDNMVDWRFMCGQMNFFGLGICSTSSGSTAGEMKNDTLNKGTTEFGTWYCWCRMTSPGVSPWLYGGQQYQYYGTCLEKCSAVCREQIKTNSSFWSRMFNSVVVN